MPVLPTEVRKHFARIGAKGGKRGRGASKARTSEQARAAVNERWRRWREKRVKG